MLCRYYSFFWYVGKGYCFFLDGWFIRNPVALFDVTKRFRMNVSGTFRNDAKDLPDDGKEIRDEVNNEIEGTYTTRYSSSHSVTDFINKARKVFPYISNLHSTSAQDTFRRR